jgi:peptide/nickel transport system substrate-binding protein
MYKKALSLVLTLLLTATVPLVFAGAMDRPYQIIIATIGEPGTVDPHWTYDTASAELIMNVYDSLFFFDDESVEDFVPRLATDWGFTPDGLMFWAEMRDDAFFHNGEPVTAADAEYSFERFIFFDRAGGPAWMILEPLFDTHGVEAIAETDEDIAAAVDAAVESNATHVWMNLPAPYAPLPVMQTLAQVWGAILNKEWAIANGCWDGDYANWRAFYNPAASPLDDPDNVMMGTGAYILDYWEHGVEWSISINDDYYLGFPAPGSRGYVTNVVEQFIDEFATRKLMFLAGDCDYCYVPRAHLEEVFGQPDILCDYPLAGLSNTHYFFTFNCTTEIHYGTGYLGPGFDPADPYVIAEDRMRIDMFEDWNMRKAFSYCFDYNQYIEDVFLNEASQPASWCIEGLAYLNPDQEKFEFDLDKAVEHFQLAWGGEIWEKGFSFTSTYNTGNEARETASYMAKEMVESLNDKFHIEVQGVEWPTFILATIYHELPVFTIGWLADYPDPHNFVYPYMHSTGTFSEWQAYSNPYVDDLISAGIKELDPDARRDIYYELQAIFVEDVVSIPLAQATGRSFKQVANKGWYFNVIHPGIYVYDRWKEDLPRTDLNEDGAVNILDVASAAAAFGSYYAAGDVHPRWASRPDLNNDLDVNIIDIAGIARDFGFVAPAWTPPS